jgi:N-formylmaleamate deformylase
VDARADLAAVPAISRWVESGLVRQHVLDYGGGGMPLVVIPGITSPAITWDFVIRRLPTGLRAIALDLRGRGLSDVGESYSLNDYAADVEAVVQELELDGAALLGHSLGARIAGVVATRRRVGLAGTIVVDPPLGGPYPTPLDAFLTQLREAREGTTPEQVAGHWPGWPAREHALRARWLATCDERAIRASHAGFETEDFLSVWRAIPTPTSLLYGQTSTVITAVGAREARAANERAMIFEVANAGHMVPWDNLPGFLAALDRALAHLGRTKPRSTGYA